MSLRSFAIGTVAAVRPKLLARAAAPAARRGVRVDQQSDALEIVRPATGHIIRIARSNAVYLVDMIESFDYFFESAAPIRVRRGGGEFAMVDFSTPRLHRIAGFDEFPIMCPSLTEPFSSIQQYVDFAALGEGDVVLDLGAYSGLTSIAFAKAVGTSGRVVAVEPDPFNLESCRYNIAVARQQAGLDTISLVAAAVTDAPGTLQLSSEGAMGSSLTSIVGRHRGRVVDVECLTLAGLVEREGLGRVDFIKMDIEGSELAVIGSSLDILRRFKPRLIIEPHKVGDQLTTEPIRAALAGIGYHCEILDQPGLALPLLTASPAVD